MSTSYLIIYITDMIETLSLRLGYGMRRAQFARAIGVTYHTVANWENGRSRPGLATLRALRAGLIAPLGYPSCDLMRRARRIAHLTQREAATLVAMPQRAWQDCESGRHRLPALKWALFLRLAGLPADFSLDYDPMRRTKGLYR